MTAPEQKDDTVDEHKSSPPDTAAAANNGNSSRSEHTDNDDGANNNARSDATPSNSTGTDDATPTKTTLRAQTSTMTDSLVTTGGDRDDDSSNSNSSTAKKTKAAAEVKENDKRRRSDPTGAAAADAPGAIAADNDGNIVVATEVDEEQGMLPQSLSPSAVVQQGTTSTTLTTTPPAPPSLPTLVRAPTTHLLVTILLPIICLATHVLFYYGQTAAMWKLRMFADIDVWANASSTIARTTFDGLGMEKDQHFVYQEDKDVKTFTYWFAIQELWEAKKMPSKTLPRVAAGLLVMFSGVWPHMKLVLLNLTFLFGRGGKGRSRLLGVLGTLGKWSLADVLVVCIMVGVLHLDWHVDPGAIKQGVFDDLPQLLEIAHSMYTSREVCEKLLHWKCDHQRNLIKKGECSACLTFIHKVFDDPQWAQKTGRPVVRGVNTSGGGLATLRVEGMFGIYAFCGAVILSIFLSILVDWYDHRANLDAMRRQHVANQLQHFMDEHHLDEPLLGTDDNNAADDAFEDADDDLAARVPPLEMDAGSVQQDRRNDYFDELRRRQQRRRHRRRQRREDSSRRSSFFNQFLFSFPYMVAACATVYAIYWALQLESMQRVVKGAGPQLLHDVLGLDLGLSYSLHSLMETTGAAGGWDILLMSTFSLFCVLGPLMRSALSASVGFLDKLPWLQESVVVPTTTIINFIGSFCAWEVFVIAIAMVDMLMPTITNTIIHSPICDQISDDGSCFQVEFNILWYAFRWIIGGGILLMIVGGWATFVGARKQESMYSTTETARSSSNRQTENHHTDDYVALRQ
eukprot:CAMPEP_0119558140 /NCGR_PEP_ID=MMETSP1352-20130426/10168_1 /TAXON_ID=265584 /ORGANISM="Stauroneis constricta, Strain CCMP1120" /LENGTH=798 /DNA_ID=CAMNT_0007605399 /DNA_START=118 /DNA_END=2514 /DNA_ORIENTATION=-